MARIGAGGLPTGAEEEEEHVDATTTTHGGRACGPVEVCPQPKTKLDQGILLTTSAEGPPLAPGHRNREGC